MSKSRWLELRVYGKTIAISIGPLLVALAAGGGPSHPSDITATDLIRDANMQTKRLTHQIISALLVLVVAACACMFLAAPEPAWGLETTKCSAKPNADSGSDVQGATDTRVTWEGQSTDAEQIAGFTLTFPEGTSYGTDNVRVTMLTGADLMERTNIDAEVIADGQTLRLAFPEPAQAGGYFRIEVYNVQFPAQGGEMQMAGTYVLADGGEFAIENIPTIAVVNVTIAEQIASWLSDQAWVEKWNSNKFLRLFLNPILLVTSFPVVLKGFLMAVGIVAVAFPVAIPIGLALALMRMSKLAVLRGIATTYVNVVRGTPLFLQIYIAFFGLPLAGINIPNFPLGVIVLAMNSSAYLCEIFRAGIQSIPKGQFEASRSLGMNGAQTMMFVIIPQTVRRVIPTMTSEFILLYKDTSMLAAVGVLEVVMYAKTIVANTGSITPYIVAAFFYLIITLPLAKVVGNLENKLAGNDAGKPKKKAKKAKSIVKEGTSAAAAAVVSAAQSSAENVEGSLRAAASKSTDAESRAISPAEHASM